MTTKEVQELLAKKPRLDLGFYPTPLYQLENLSKKLGINLYVKREDYSGKPSFGGNKIRKLEYLLGDAKANGAEYVFTYGATQSNHAMQTVEVANMVGLKPILYLLAIVEPNKDDIKSNLLLDEILGAEVHIIKKLPGETDAEGDARMYELGRRQIAELEAAGHKCYDIPMGGASPIGSAGFIGGFVEMQDQLDAMNVHADYIFQATGTGGTMAGLVAGKKITNSDVEIVSVDVCAHPADFDAQSADLANKALEWIGAEPIVQASDFHLEPKYYLPGYEMPNEYGTNGIKTMAKNEGLLLDSVYSGKAFGALLDFVETGKIKPGSNVVFMHTGGATALFAEKAILGDIV